jgi:hypothetical protein
MAQACSMCTCRPANTEVTEAHFRCDLSAAAAACMSAAEQPARSWYSLLCEAFRDRLVVSTGFPLGQALGQSVWCLVCPVTQLQGVISSESRCTRMVQHLRRMPSTVWAVWWVGLGCIVGCDGMLEYAELCLGTAVCPCRVGKPRRIHGIERCAAVCLFGARASAVPQLMTASVTLYSSLSSHLAASVISTCNGAPLHQKVCCSVPDRGKGPCSATVVDSKPQCTQSLSD